MRVRVLRNLGREWPQAYAENQVVEVEESLAEKLVQAGLAEPVAEPAPGQPDEQMETGRPARKGKGAP